MSGAGRLAPVMVSGIIESDFATIVKGAENELSDLKNIEHTDYFRCKVGVLRVSGRSRGLNELSAKSAPAWRIRWCLLICYTDS